MPLGLPVEEARIAVGRAFVRGQHAIAFTALTGTVLAIAVMGQAVEDAPAWPGGPGTLLLLIGIAVLAIRQRRDSAVVTLLYLTIIMAGLFLFALAYLSSDSALRNAGFTLLPVKAALIMVGSARISAWRGIGWAITGWAAAEAAVLGASAVTDSWLPFDVAAFTLMLLVVGIRPLIVLMTPSIRRARPSLAAAARDEAEATLTVTIESRAAALVHDTVLNQLAAIATAPPGTVTPALSGALARDVEILRDRAWLREESVTESDVSDWERSELFRAVRDARILGLAVETTGDLTALTRLNREQSRAVALATSQCLTNVYRHAGTLRAEVAVYAAEGEVCVMVVDSGVGFDVNATALDRLGLRMSVRRRIESVGGSVQVWSTPGRGTSVMLRVPVATPDAPGPGDRT